MENTNAVDGQKDVHPEPRRSTALTREEHEELLELRRKHYQRHLQHGRTNFAEATLADIRYAEQMIAETWPDD